MLQTPEESTKRSSQRISKGKSTSTPAKGVKNPKEALKRERDSEEAEEEILVKRMKNEEVRVGVKRRSRKPRVPSSVEPNNLSALEVAVLERMDYVFSYGGMWSNAWKTFFVKNVLGEGVHCTFEEFDKIRCIICVLCFTITVLLLQSLFYNQVLLFIRKTHRHHLTLKNVPKSKELSKRAFYQMQEFRGKSSRKRELDTIQTENECEIPEHYDITEREIPEYHDNKKPEWMIAFERNQERAQK
jgi:hypothetical protein